MEQTGIKTVMNENATSKAVFQVLSSRKRYRKHTTLLYFKALLERKGYEIVDNDLISTFQKLEKEGAGKVVYHRNTKEPLKFIWSYDLKDVAKLAKGQKTIDEVVRIIKEAHQIKPKEIILRKAEVNMIKDETPALNVMLPANSVLNITLPKNISLDRVQGLLKQLFKE